MMVHRCEIGNLSLNDFREYCRTSGGDCSPRSCPVYSPCRNLGLDPGSWPERDLKLVLVTEILPYG